MESTTPRVLGTEYILPLAPLQHTDSSQAGTKAANLGELAGAGFPVPAGFVLTAAAFARFRAANDLRAADSVERVAAAAIPAEVEEALLRAAAPFAGAPLAVRSSAVAEDLPGASFAGQYDTVLGVRGPAALLAAVRRCWASAFNARSAAYRVARGPASSGDMGVLIQRLVPADAAGVACTANPLTGDRGETLVSAVRGLGERLVSGQATPDEWSVRGTAAHCRRNAEGALDAGQACAVATLARRVEAHFGCPQDVEWALDGAGLWLLQARPLTALPEPVSWQSPVPGAKWTNDLMTAEWATEPLSPLGASTTFEAMAVAREQVRGWPPVPKMRAPGHITINGWLYMRVDLQPLTLVANLLAAMVGILTGTPNGHRRARRVWPRRLAALAALERTDLATLPDAALRRHSDLLLHELGAWWIEVSSFRSTVRVAEQFIAGLRAPGRADAAALFRGNDSLLLAAERALRRAAADETQVDAYLARFGHFVESADPIHAMLRESPEHLAWQLAAARLTGQDPNQRLAGLRQERARAEAALRRLRGMHGYLARRLLAVGQSHAAHTDDAVFHFQRVLAALRATFLETGRRLAAAGALERAADVFYLERAELWQAPAGEWRPHVAQRRALREQRKRLAPPPFIPPVADPAWSADPLFKRMPAAARSAMLERGVRAGAGRRVLAGTPGSPGRARGIARVVTSPADFTRFQPGDVLVARATSPIWTPLFGIAAAAVTEVGGPFAHAAIVAREFGIPLVDGALEATRVIGDGTPVLVDGSAGIVEF